MGDLMGQILGRVLGNAGGAATSGTGGGGGLGDVLGGMLGGPRAPVSGEANGAGGGRGGMLMALLLPLAIQWVQRNGGIGGVLDRFRQHGYGAQANSWVAPGANQPIGADQVSQVVGADELTRLAQQLGVDRQQVASGLAEILPHMVDQLTPGGQLAPNADQALDHGRITLEQALGELRST